MPSPRDVTVFGTRRATLVQSQIQSNERDEMLIAQGLPVGAEQTRKGQSWATMSTAAVAGLVIRPTTVAAFEIYNGNAAGGLSMVIDRLFWFNLVSVTGVANAFLGWACVTNATGKAAITSGSFAVRGNSGKAYGGSVIAAAGTTIVDSGWFPWGAGGSKSTTEATVTPAGGVITEVAGRLIVPPGSSLCLHVVGPTTAATYTQGASWYEEQLTIV